MSIPRKTIIVLVNLVIFWLALPAGFYGLGRLVDSLEILTSFPPWTRWLGTAVAAAGAWICIHAGVLLRVKGRGLPISALPPTRLVTTGPYRYWTHPIYTGYLLLIAGLGLLLESPGTSLVATPVLGILWYLTWVKLYEEPGLLRRFGAAFRAHRKRTGLLLPFRLRNAARAVIMLAFRLVYRVRVIDADNAPASRPILFISDHLSYMDFMFAHHAHGRPVVIPVTAEAFRSPLKRFFFWVMGAVPKRRFCSDPAAARAIEDELTAGGAVGIAVEGERSWTGEFGRVAPSVAINIGRYDVPMVPVVFVGSYRLWPRWAAGPNRKAEVVVRVGKPFRIREELDGFLPGDPERSEEVARLIESKLASLRDPNESSVDISSYPSPRPELVLWSCPVCRAEESLSMKDKQYLECDSCRARWDTAGGDLTLVSPEDRKGERHTLAGWAKLAEKKPDMTRCPEILIESADVELREEPHARVTLDPLRSLGSGKARLFKDRIEWQNCSQTRVVPLSEVCQVTTERNDTLELGTRRGVIQLVLRRSSPLRWTTYLNQLKETGNVR